MATKRVNIDIVAKDKSQQALNRVRGSLDKVKASVFNVRNALAGLGAGLVIRNLVNTGQEIESLQVRLKFLFGTAEEGAKAFDNMAKFAAKVPFSLEQIQQGAGVLSVISKDADELSDIMEITGNVAAVTGLDFKTASEQIQRSLSAGIASADLFRERGVRDLLGFKAGATVTAEETAEAFKRVFGKGGQFGDATGELAKTFEGTLSMIGDKFFTFKKTILEAGFFPELKKQFGDLDKFLEDNGRTIDEIAVKIGKGLAQATKTTADTVKFLADNFETLKGILTTIIALKVASFFYGIATAVGAANVALVTFNRTALVTKGRLGVLTSAMALFNGEFGLMAKLEQNEADAKEKSSKESTKQTEHLRKANEVVKQNNEENKKAIDIIKEYKNGLVDLNIQQARMEDVQTGMSDRDLEKVKEANKERKEGVEFLKKLNAENKEELKIIQKNYYEKFTESMSKRYRKEQELIRITKKEQEVMNEAYTKAMLKRGRINDEVMSKQQTALTSFTEGFKEQMNAQGTALEQFNQAGKRAFDSFADTLTNALLTGKFAFQDFARSVILDITRIIAKQMIMLALQKAAGFFGFGGFSLGGLLSFGGGKAQGGAVQGGKAYMVGEKGPEMFVPNQSGNIVPNNQIGNAQPVNVNFNINTVDARGFNELLVNSRGLIVNMINSAVNEKGRQAIV